MDNDSNDDLSPSPTDIDDGEGGPLSAVTLDETELGTTLDQHAFELELENELENELESLDEECPHLLSLLAIEASKVTVLRKFKSAVVWAAQHQPSSRPAKRRKVCTCIASLRGCFGC